MDLRERVTHLAMMLTIEQSERLEAVLAVNDRGNGTPPFRVKGTPVRACEGHAG